MTSDWINDMIDGEPTPITYRQLVIIDTMIDRTSISEMEKGYILSKLNNYTELEAEEIIKKIFENEVKTDPQDQWKKMLKDNVFGNRDF
tara:strand:+ start:682 stop:948 length:267 start_codon:yes stop_codon:yes gene_type:complete